MSYQDNTTGNYTRTSSSSGTTTTGNTTTFKYTGETYTTTTASSGTTTGLYGTYGLKFVLHSDCPFKVCDQIQDLKTLTLFTVMEVNDDIDTVRCLGESNCLARVMLGNIFVVKIPASEYKNYRLIGKKQDEVTKMDINDIDTKNLKEAQKQFDSERANAEVEEAKRFLRTKNDRMDTLKREIKVRTEELKKINDELKVFKRR